MANAASLRQRPVCDQAVSTIAATIGPTPHSSSRSGRQDRTMVRIARSCSSASVCRARMRRARVRSVDSAVKVSMSVVAAPDRTRLAMSIISRVEWPRKRARTGSGTVITRARS
jgi:hypothetical protein